MRIKMPEDVGLILQTLEAAGYEACIVGGCVRDSLLGREPKDWDITTSAMPCQVKALFRRTVDTGIRHGTVTVMIGRVGYEVTTYRIDGEYEDGRHPKQVSFTGNLREDLQRRDFTINAMAYHHDRGLVDLFGGLDDLAAGRIRCVGDAGARFTEDALRVMRAVRFAAQLGFEIEEDTAAAARELAGNLRKISPERVRMELEKLLLSPHPELIETACALGITSVVLPEYDALAACRSAIPVLYGDARQHTGVLLQQSRPERCQRFAALLYYGGPPAAEKVMRRLRFDNASRIRTEALLRFGDMSFANTEPAMRRFLYEAGEELFPDLVFFKKALIAAGDPDCARVLLRDLEEKESLFEKVTKEKQCFGADRLAVGGSDLIAAGLLPGKELGELLHALLDEVILDQTLNTKETLLKMALDRHRPERGGQTSGHSVQKEEDFSG